jgi:ankyrin repeat protein
VEAISGFTRFDGAVKYGSVDMVAFLYEGGYCWPHYEHNVMGCRPLHSAMKYSHTQVVRFLLEQDENYIEYIDMRNRTLLHIAATHGNVLVMELLSSKYVFTLWEMESVMDINREIPLHAAASGGYTEAIRFFLDHGVHICTEDNSGFFPEHKAIMGGHIDSLKFLISAKDIYRHGRFEYRLPVSKKLLQHGYLPLYMATMAGHKDMVLFLLMISRWLDIGARDEYGCTPLLLVVKGET